jgi:hypothetical protein
MAHLTVENIDWSDHVLAYARSKTGSPAFIHFGPAVETVLRSLPTKGLLLPKIALWMEKHRAKEFKRRCVGLGIHGVTLHSYRYAWAERAKQCGYPDPSNAMADAGNHDHYLIQRPVEAIDYDDNNGEPNWASWNLTAEDIGPAKRTPAFHADAELPASFHHITSADYIRSGFDRGHMCLSADRTDNGEPRSANDLNHLLRENDDWVPSDA